MIPFFSEAAQLTSHLGLFVWENGNYYRVLGLYADKGKEYASYFSVLGLFGDNAKAHGNYYSIFGFDVGSRLPACRQRTLFRETLQSRLGVSFYFLDPHNKDYSALGSP